MEQVLEVRDISKAYERPAARTGGNGGPGGPEQGGGLGNVSFQLFRGDVLGVIGRNGTGKSTLLKILAGILLPTAGTAWYRGRLVSILEFGTGFHPDLTGMENIHMNAALLGMNRAEIAQRCGAIVDFSELGDAIYDPVKNYSNGMYLRLAFSVFTHLFCDILLLDEVISTGDFAFRQKCYDRIRDLAAGGTTIVVVSHHPDAIRHLCNKFLWLDKSGMVAFGESPAILDDYLEQCVTNLPSTGEEAVTVDHFCLTWRSGMNIGGEVRMLRFGLRAKGKDWEDPIFQTDDLEMEIEFEKLNDKEQIEIGISILALFEAWVLVDSHAIYYRFHEKVLQPGIYRCRYLVPAGILNFGKFQLGLMVTRSQEMIYQNPFMVNFDILFQEQEGLRNHLARRVTSIVKPTGSWHIEKL